MRLSRRRPSSRCRYGVPRRRVSLDRARSIGGRVVPGREFHDRALGPVTVVFTRRRADEPAVAAESADDRRDGTIVPEVGSLEWLHRHKWIVLRGDDERRDPDARHDAHRAGATVVVLL